LYGVGKLHERAEQASAIMENCFNPGIPPCAAIDRNEEATVL
jgi:hypothetical protein